MTFDEVWEREVMFFDFRDWSDEEVCPCSRVGRYLDIPTVSEAVMLDDSAEDWKEYGKSWRCWNIRPTDEQRRNTGWKGDDDA